MNIFVSCFCFLFPWWQNYWFSSTPIPFFLEYLNRAKNDPTVKIFTRLDFLSIDPTTAQSWGNRMLFDHLKLVSEGETHETDLIDYDEAAKWQCWQRYPDLDPIDTLVEGPGLHLMAWVVDTFGDVVTNSKISKDPNDPLCNLSVDDFVFIFVQAQHNINKWNLMNWAFENNWIKAWKDKESVAVCECDKKSLGKEYELFKKICRLGNEYPFGSGVAGVDGQKRYHSMTKYLYRAYYRNMDNDDIVAKNRLALGRAVRKLWDERELYKANTEEDRRITKRSRMRYFCSDPELDDIHDHLWANSCLGESNGKQCFSV